MNLDYLMMCKTLWNAIVMTLNFMIPIVLPDGTKIGAVIFFAVIGLLIAIVAGKKVPGIFRKIFRDLTN